jgi:phosphoglycolate phosphatase
VSVEELFDLGFEVPTGFGVGTLWDTCETCAVAWNDVLVRLGIDYRIMTAADVRAVAGRPHLEGIRRAFPGLDERDVVRVAQATALADNEAIARDGGFVYPGVREHVPELARRLPLMIVSNCQSGYIETFLAWTGLAPHFVDFECWGNTGDTKAENLGSVIARNRVRYPLFIGDTEGDRVAADENGVRFVHVTWGFGEVARCDQRVDRFAEIAALIP